MARSLCAIPEASHPPSRGSGETGRDAATAALWKKHAHDQVRDSAYKPSVFSICFMRSRRSTNGSLRQHTISLPKKPQDSRNRAAFIGDIPDRADSLYNHVINHARIACVYVINTHATAGSDRGLDDFALLVHNAPAPFENITARIIRAVLILMNVPVTVISSVVVAPCPLCPLPVELVCANASGTTSAQARVTIAFFIIVPPS